MNSISPGAVALFCGAPHDLRPLHKLIKHVCPDQAGLTLAVAQGYVRVVLGLANGQHLGTSTAFLGASTPVVLGRGGATFQPGNLAYKYLQAKSRRLVKVIRALIPCSASSWPALPGRFLGRGQRQILRSLTKSSQVMLSSAVSEPDWLPRPQRQEYMLERMHVKGGYGATQRH